MFCLRVMFSSQLCGSLLSVLTLSMLTPGSACLNAASRVFLLASIAGNGTVYELILIFLSVF